MSIIASHFTIRIYGLSIGQLIAISENDIFLNICTRLWYNWLPFCLSYSQTVLLVWTDNFYTIQCYSPPLGWRPSSGRAKPCPHPSGLGCSKNDFVSYFSMALCLISIGQRYKHLRIHVNKYWWLLYPPHFQTPWEHYIWL